MDLRDQTGAHPCHPIYAARTLVAGMEIRSPRARIDAPDVQEAIVGGAKAS